MISPAELKRFRVLARKFGVDLSVLYGSSVTGNPGPEPDIDIAVRLKKYTDRKAQRFFSEIYRCIHNGTIDLVFINRIDPLLQMEIARKGQPLYEASPGLYRRFQVYATKRNNDAGRFYKADRTVVNAFLNS
jgi:predicted nucleotidyltransferase